MSSQSSIPRGIGCDEGSPVVAAGAVPGQFRPDFVAPASHMRKLFKLKQSKAAVHVAVKRVGGTLVLDGVGPRAL